MDHQNQITTAAWRFQVWISFAMAVFSTGMGISYLPIDGWMRAFLAMGFVFTIGSCFSLAKTLRDDHESKRLVNRITEAKAEKILREYELGGEEQLRAA